MLMTDKSLERNAGFVYGTRVIFVREISAYFDSSIAYVYASVFLLLSSSICSLPCSCSFLLLLFHLLLSDLPNVQWRRFGFASIRISICIGRY